MAGPLDLSRFAPNPIAEFKLRNGRVYKMWADPTVDNVARMLRIEGAIRGTEEDADTAAALLEGKELVCDLIREVEPDADLDGFEIGTQEMLFLFTVLVHGETVAVAVLEAISGGDPAAVVEDGSGDPVASEQAFGKEPGGDVAPLASAKPSPEPSSLSDEEDDGLRPTGTA